MIRRKITIVSIGRPPQVSLNQELQWFGEMLGLFGERDRDRSCFRIFIELIRARKHGLGLSSDDIAEHLNLTRGTVIHHVNNMMQRGIIVHEGRRYFLRADSLEQLIQELRRDAEEVFNRLKNTARELDNMLNL